MPTDLQATVRRGGRVWPAYLGLALCLSLGGTADAQEQVTVTGYVKPAEGQAAAAGGPWHVSVRIRAAESGPAETLRTVTTDAAGVFRIRVVPGSRCAFEVKPSNNQRVWGEATVDVPSRTRRDVTVVVRVRPTLRIAGKLVNEAGQPVPQVRFYLWPEAGDESYPAVWSDEQGLFEFAALTAAGRYGIKADGQGYSTERPQVIELNESGKDVVLKLVRELAVRVQLVNAEGEPVLAEGDIRLRGRKSRGAPLREGVAEISGIYQGSYEPRLSGPVASRYRLIPDQSVRVAGKGKETLEATLVVLPRPAVRVKVVDEVTGEPVPQATIIAAGQAHRTKATADADGVASVYYGDGAWRLSIQAAGYRMGQADITTAMKTGGIHTLKLFPIMHGTIDVLDPQGRAVSEGTAQVLGLANGRILIKASEISDGHARVPAPCSGDRLVYVHTKDRGAAYTRWPAGQDLATAVRLKAYQRVRITMADIPKPDHTYWIALRHAASGVVHQTAVFRPRNARVATTHLIPGTYDVILCDGTNMWRVEALRVDAAGGSSDTHVDVAKVLAKTSMPLASLAQQNAERLAAYLQSPPAGE